MVSLGTSLTQSLLNFLAVSSSPKLFSDLTFYPPPWQSVPSLRFTKDSHISPARTSPLSFSCTYPTAHLAPDASDTYQNPYSRTCQKIQLKSACIARGFASHVGQVPAVALWALGTAFRLVARWLLPFQTHPDVTMSSKIKSILFSQRSFSKNKKSFPRSSP